MSTRMQRTTLDSLKLPTEFEDLTGVIQNDLKVIVSVLTAAGHGTAAPLSPRVPAAPEVPLEQPDRDHQQGPRAPLGRASLSRDLSRRDRRAGPSRRRCCRPYFFRGGHADGASGPRRDGLGRRDPDSRALRGASRTRASTFASWPPSPHSISSTPIRWPPPGRNRPTAAASLYRDRDEWPGDRATSEATRSCTSSSAAGPTCWSSPRSTPTPWRNWRIGLCDNFLTCLFRAWDFARPVILAPAMNTLMWQSPVTARHLGQLLLDHGGVARLPEGWSLERPPSTSPATRPGSSWSRPSRNAWPAATSAWAPWPRWRPSPRSSGGSRKLKIRRASRCTTSVSVGSCRMLTPSQSVTTLVTFGDSILDSGRYNAHGLTPGATLVKNDDAIFPEFRGRDLSSAGPARLEHRAVDGAVSRISARQCQGLHVDGPAIAILTIGGNDLLGGLARDHGPGIDAFARTLEDFLAIMPIRPVLLGNVYDPTLGDDCAELPGYRPVAGPGRTSAASTRPSQVPPSATAASWTSTPTSYRRPILVHDDHRAEPPRLVRGPAVLSRGHHAMEGRASGQARVTHRREMRIWSIPLVGSAVRMPLDSSAQRTLRWADPVAIVQRGSISSFPLIMATSTPWLMIAIRGGTVLSRSRRADSRCSSVRGIRILTKSTRRFLVKPTVDRPDSARTDLVAGRRRGEASADVHQPPAQLAGRIPPGSGPGDSSA